MVDAIVEVLIVELLIGSVKLSDPDAEAQHDIFVFHEGEAVLEEPALLVDVSLPRVERAQNHTARRRILQQARVRRRANRVLREFRVQVARATVFILAHLLFVKDIGELLADQVLLLLIKDVDFLFRVIEPRMVKNLFCT